MGLSHLFLALVATQALATVVPNSENEHVKRQSATITVNTATTYQSMDGFGFSEAFGFVGGVYSLPSTQQKQCLDLLFSPSAGAGLNIVRNRIGSTSSDSIEPNSPGSPSATPKYVGLPNSDSNQLWFSQKAQGYGVKTFYADAWSAPGYMKTNGNEANGGYLCGVTGETCSSGDWKQAYANYLVQYLKDYQAAGVDVTYVGFLNEPEYAPSYSSMLSDGTKAASFINVLYPTLQSSGLSTKIACCDAEGWNDQKTFTGQLISAGVESKLGLITSHSYTSQPNGPISTDLHVWQTEYADLDGTGTTAWYSSGAMGEGLTWANLIYQAVVNSGVSGYLHWIGSQSGNSNAALVPIVNNAPVATGRLWAFGQWSRYVRPGAVRVATSGGTSTLLTSAFKNTDGTLSVQVINNGNSAVSVTVAPSGFTAASVTAYSTSNSNNAIGTTSASVSGGKVTGSVPSRGMVTFVLSGSGSSVPPGTTTSVPGSSPTTSSTPPSTSTSSGGTVAEYGQCGGQGYTGPTTCASPYTCKYSNPYYSQCL